MSQHKPVVSLEEQDISIKNYRVEKYKNKINISINELFTRSTTCI